MSNKEHSPKYKKVKEFYELGTWKIDRVLKAVQNKWITPEEFKEITGQDYPDPNNPIEE